MEYNGFWATGLGQYSEGPDANDFRLCPETLFIELGQFHPDNDRAVLRRGKPPLFALRYIFPCAASNSSSIGLRSRRRFGPPGSRIRNDRQI
jgi:hypothetical protein